MFGGLQKGFLLGPQAKPAKRAPVKSESTTAESSKEAKSAGKIGEQVSSSGVKNTSTAGTRPMSSEPMGSNRDVLEGSSVPTSSLPGASTSSGANAIPLAKPYSVGGMDLSDTEFFKMAYLVGGALSPVSSSGLDFSEEDPELLNSPEFRSMASGEVSKYVEKVSVAAFTPTCLAILDKMGVMQQNFRASIKASASNLLDWSRFLHSYFRYFEPKNYLKDLEISLNKKFIAIFRDFSHFFLVDDPVAYKQLARDFVQKALALQAKDKYELYKLYELWLNFSLVAISKYFCSIEFFKKICEDNINKLACFIRAEILCGFCLEHLAAVPLGERKFPLVTVSPFFADPLEHGLLKNYTYYDPQAKKEVEAYSIFKKNIYLRNIFHPSYVDISKFLAKIYRYAPQDYNSPEFKAYREKFDRIVQQIGRSFERALLSGKEKKYLTEEIDIRNILERFKELSSSYDSNNSLVLANIDFARIFTYYLKLVVAWDKLSDMPAKTFTQELFLAGSMALLNAYFSLPAEDYAKFDLHEARDITERRIREHGVDIGNLSFFLSCERLKHSYGTSLFQDPLFMTILQPMIEVFYVYNKSLLPFWEKTNFAELSLERDAKFLKLALQCMIVCRVNMQILEEFQEIHHDFLNKIEFAEFVQNIKEIQSKLPLINMLEKTITDKISSCVGKSKSGQV